MTDHERAVELSRELLRLIKNESKLSDGALASKAGMSDRALRSIRAGRSAMTLSSLVALARAAGLESIAAIMLLAEAHTAKLDVEMANQ